MADEDKDQKTEGASQRKLQQARDDGNIPVSRELAHWTLLLGIVLVTAILLPYCIQAMLAPLTAFFAQAGVVRVGEESSRAVFGHLFSLFALPLLTLAGSLLTIALSGWLMQTGLVWNLNLLRLHWEKLNPAAGLARLFSTQALADLLKSLSKILVIGYVAYTMIQPLFFKAATMTGLEPAGMVHALFTLTNNILLMVFLAFTAIVAADVAYQRYTYFTSLRMSKQDLKEEHRQAEGDPQIKARLRQLRQNRARQRLTTTIPKADVIITNPTHYAVALKYEPGKMQAPIVLAKGQDFLAKTIRELGQSHNIPLVNTPPLARVLYATVEIDEAIPPEHYRAVAEVISYVYRLRGKNNTNQK